MTKIYIANLEDYSENILTGKWVELPLAEKELELAIQSVLGDEGHLIADYDADFCISKYEDVRKLNAFVEKLESLSSCDQEKVAFLLERYGYSREKALDSIDDVIFYKGMTLKEVAGDLKNDGCFWLACNLKKSGYHETKKGVFRYYQKGER